MYVRVRMSDSWNQSCRQLRAAVWGLGIEPVILRAEPFPSPAACLLLENAFPLWQATDVAQAGLDL